LRRGYVHIPLLFLVKILVGCLRCGRARQCIAAASPALLPALRSLRTSCLLSACGIPCRFGLLACGIRLLRTLGGGILLNVPEEAFHLLDHVVLHHAHMIIDRHIETLQDRDDFLAAHVERLGVFVDS
jgi:hypothetical protein